MANAHCASCGAPDDGESVICKYCQRPISQEAQAHAIPCPKCRVPNRWGKQQCSACQTWIVVACVFCGAISPHNQQACMACREPFAGAVERKAQRQQQHAHQQSMQTLGTVGNIAASFLGAAAGAHFGSSYGHHSSWSSESHTWSDSTSSDGPPVGEWSGSSDYDSGSSSFDTGSSGGDFDFGGGDSGGGDFGGGWDE